MKQFLRILAYGKPYRRYWPPYLLLSIFSVIFGIANFALIAPLLAVLFEPESVAATTVCPPPAFSVDFVKGYFQYHLAGIAREQGVLRALLFVCGVLCLASLLSNLSHWVSQRVLVSMRTRVMMNMREDLFRKINELDLRFFHGRHKGDILSSISNDVNEVQASVASSFHIIFRDPLLVIGFLCMLFYMSPRLTVVALLTLPVSAVLISRISRSLRGGAKQTQSILGVIVSRFEEAISGNRIVKAFNAQDFLQTRFNALNREHRRVSRHVFNRQELASPMSEFLGISIAAAILFMGGWLQLRGELGMTWPAFVVYIGFYWRVLEPAKAIAKAYANIRKGMVSGARIFEILDAPITITEDPHPLPLSEFTQSIHYHHVTFQYEGMTEPVLHQIDLEIPKGAMVALVGPSGSGKTTLAHLLPRFYDVTSGEVLLDGVDIRRFKIKELRQLMGIVTQEPILFNDTIAHNIAFGLEEASQEDIEAAAKVANAHDFIMQLPQGYDTSVGDRGDKLSGGQRQRIAIARAVLKNPPLLILDEATSALDTESEHLVQEALSHLMQNRTTLVIAHRLSTIQQAHRIVVLDKGHIVEQGTHNELMSQKGLYNHLYHVST